MVFVGLVFAFTIYNSDAYHTYTDLEFKCYESEDNTGDIVLSLNNYDDSGGDTGGENEEDSNQELIDAITQSNNNLANTITESNQNVVNAIEEQNETSKGILATIGDIVSYLNPLSENFFVYKLIELLVDALKSLFVPSDDFFTNWIDDLNSYFGECFGILYYPFELLIDFLNRVASIEDSMAVINVPEFKISLMGYNVTFIQAFSYDFNELLVNDTFKNIHNIYLVIVDLLLWLGVVFLASKCLRSIIGGISGETISNISTSKKEE